MYARQYVTTSRDRAARNQARGLVAPTYPPSAGQTGFGQNDPTQLLLPSIAPTNLISLSPPPPNTGHSPQRSLLDVSENELTEMLTVDRLPEINCDYSQFGQPLHYSSRRQFYNADIARPIAHDIPISHPPPCYLGSARAPPIHSPIPTTFPPANFPREFPLAPEFSLQKPHGRNEGTPKVTLRTSQCPEGLSKTDRTVVLELIKRIKLTGAYSEVELVQFLKDVSPIFEMSPSNSREIIKLLLPCVKDQLFELWLIAINQSREWDELHEKILDQFIPAVRRREIENIEIDRPQNINESFSGYVESVIGAAYALKSRLSEQEVIEIILSKALPDTKKHFYFENRPKNIAELKSLANKINSLIRTEMRCNAGHGGHLAFSGPNRNPTAGNTFRTERRRENARSDGRGVKTCYRCGTPGHLARDCRNTSLNW